MLKNIAEDGLELLKGESSIRRQWLEKMLDRYTFLDKEFPALMERWEKQQVKNRGKLLPNKD